MHKLYPAGSGPAAGALSGAEFLDKLARAPLLHQPGAVWDYGFGLDVLGLVVEQHQRADARRHTCASNVFKPLGMADTEFLIPADKAQRYAKALPNDPDTGQPQSLWR